MTNIKKVFKATRIWIALYSVPLVAMYMLFGWLALAMGIGMSLQLAAIAVVAVSVTN